MRAPPGRPSTIASRSASWTHLNLYGRLELDMTNHLDLDLDLDDQGAA
ncbi:hypothetical protein NE236_36060 [Actinoallomurus purpureus]|nr:hypothetical protein [Actinoallomurus purpureus]MCO6010393.1 hypothetical protein [Actinoallomurus purpureus]